MSALIIPLALFPSWVVKGSVYASEVEVFMYWGGGINSVTGQAFSDLYLIDTVNDVFTPCPSLPTTLAYSSVHWCEALESMVLYTGVISAPKAPDSYLQSVLLLALPTVSASQCSYTTTSISSNMLGRKFASTALLSTVMYVFGGFNQGVTLSSSQSWFSIDLISSSTTMLSTSTVGSSINSGFPPGVIAPALLVDAPEFLLYVYGGLTAPVGAQGSVSAPSNLMYRFDAERGVWLAPITPLIASNSAQISSYPLIALACFTPGDPLGESMVYVGGTDGLNNSLDSIVLIDLSTDTMVGVPTITTLFTQLPMGLQGCAVGRNQLQELTVLTGLSVGIDSFYGAYPTSVVEATLPLLATSFPVDQFTSFLPAVDTTDEWAVSARPLPREGAAYGCDGTLIYIAGGAYITSSSILALSDIWVLNTTADVYTAGSARLPVAVYYAVSEWVQSQRALYIFGGRTNTAGNAVTNTYSDALYKVDFTNIIHPLITKAALVYTNSSPPLQGVHFASSVLLGASMYVWGGLSGANGSVPLFAQQFFSISLTSFVVSMLPMSAKYDFYPSSIWIAPALFSLGQNVYLYGGLAADHVSWSNPAKLFVFNTVEGQWNEDIPVLLSPYTALPSQWSNVALAARAYSSDGLHVLLVGGTQGDKAVNGPGSHNRIVHVDLTALAANVSSGQPIVSVLPSTLLQPVQSAVVGLTAANQALFCFSGATYLTTASTYPVSYSSHMITELLQTGYESTGSSNVIVNPTPVTVQSVAMSSVSGGQIAGIAIGSVLGSTLLLLLAACAATGQWRSLISSVPPTVWVSGRRFSPQSAIPHSEPGDHSLRSAAAVAGTERGAEPLSHEAEDEAKAEVAEDRRM